MGVPAWGHHLTMTAFGVQDAGHPFPTGHQLDDPALAIVQGAPVAGQGVKGPGWRLGHGRGWRGSGGA